MKYKELIFLGNWDNGSQSGDVYSQKGISPTITTTHPPKILMGVPNEQPKQTNYIDREST